jgi:hypothetical protein
MTKLGFTNNDYKYLHNKNKVDVVVLITRAKTLPFLCVVAERPQKTAAHHPERIKNII